MPQTESRRASLPDLEAVFALRPVASRKAVEEAVAQLTQLIKLGTVAAGDYLPPERELLSRLQVSRGTLREAIRVLEANGLVSVVRGRLGGTRVRNDMTIRSEQDARDLAKHLAPSLDALLDFREVIEAGVAELAAQRASPGEIDEVYAILDKMKTTDPREYRRAHAQLHLRIAGLARSPKLADALASLLVQYNDLFSAASLIQLATQNSDQLHRRIVDAIREQDSERARRETLTHLRVPRQIVRHLLSSLNETYGVGGGEAAGGSRVVGRSEREETSP